MPYTWETVGFVCRTREIRGFRRSFASLIRLSRVTRVSMNKTLALLPIALVAVIACARRPNTDARTDATAQPAPNASSVASAVPTPSATNVANPAAPGAAPITKLTPRARPPQKSICPLTIEPGVGFGPIDLGMTMADVEKTGLVKKNADSRSTIVDLGAVKAAFCDGKVVDVWMEDLRLAPDCVTFGGKPVNRDAPREDLMKRFGGCSPTLHHIGGSFEPCDDHGVYLGYGMGNFLQIRVEPKGFDMDELCPRMEDDGSAITLTPAQRSKILQRALDVHEASPFWHPDKPGRDPLRITKSDFIPDQPVFTMFGSPVKWIDPSEAKPGSAFLKVTGFTTSKTRVYVSYTYPVEGMSAKVELRPSETDDWRVHHTTLTER